MYAITRRLDVLSPVLIDCDYSGGEKGSYYGYNSYLQRKRVRVHDVSKRFEPLRGR